MRRMMPAKSRWKLIGAILASVIVAMAAVLIAVPGLLPTGGGGKGSGGPGPTGIRAVIHADPDRASENEAVEFSGAESVGNITAFHWDFGDGDGDDGANVTHSYRDAGKYTVTLTVSDAKGRSHTDTAYIHVDHHENHSGTLSMGQTRSYILPVETDCMGARVTLSYPTGQMIGGVPANDLDITLFFPNGTAYADSRGQPAGAGTTQVRELTIPSQEMAAAFYKDWSIRAYAASGINVDFDLEIEVDY